MDKKLFKNTFFLYLIIFSSYFFGFLTIPYLTRLLGPEIFGQLGLAMSVTIYLKLIIDFGFVISGTREVTLIKSSSGNLDELSKVLTLINTSKILISTVLLMILSIVVNTIPFFEDNGLLILLFFINAVISSLIPDFLYRGIEETKILAYRTFISQLLIAISIFIIVRDASDLLLVPILNIVGNFISLIYVYFHVKYNLKIRIFNTQFSFKEIYFTFKDSSKYFYSRIASTVYTVSNTLILSSVYPSQSSQIGNFYAVDKLISTLKTGFSPISDSMYPYMLREKNYKLLFKLIVILTTPLIILAVLIMNYSSEAMIFLFGNEYAKAGEILSILIWIIVFTPSIYLLGFPLLSPIGKGPQANHSLIIAAIFHIFGFVILFLLDSISLKTVTYLTLFSHGVILIHRLVLLIFNYNQFVKEQNNETSKSEVV